MNIMKWMRKNKNKLMAVVVVLIMIAFTVPTLISQWGRPGIKGNAPVAHYNNNKGEITNDDLRSAQTELGVLKALGADLFLQSRPSVMQTADIPSLALSQVLFSESRLAPMIDQEIKRIAREQQLRLADWQVDDFFRQQSREKPEIIWLLLKAEARAAGFTVTAQEAGTVLKAVIPQLPQMKGHTAEEVLSAMMQRQGVDQETILQTFADLMAVSEYANLVTQNEDVTVAQLKYDTLRQSQSMEIEAVIFNAESLAKKAAEPAGEALQKQFNAYKAYMPFDVNAENPYGFGYKQPPRAQLEWMLLDRADVAKQVPVPTAEQAEEYYQRNQALFTKQVPSDPNDPNSQKVDQLQPYAAVAAQIAKQLLETRIAERADNILIAAKDMADANLVSANVENLTVEQMQKLAGDYKAAAEKVGKNFGLTIYTGKTGFVDAEDIAQNEILGRLVMLGQDKSPTRLMSMVFAIDQLKASRLSPFAPAKPQMFESIGPLKDYTQQKVVGLVRVIGAQKAAEPCNIDIAYAKKLPVMRDGKFAESNDVYSVKDAVKEDIKKLEALPIAKQAADALLAAVPASGWDKALEAVNKQYGIAPAESNKPATTFKVNPLKGLRRISEAEVKMMQVRAAHEPVQAMFVKQYAQQKELIDILYSLLAPDKTTATNVPMLVEFKPQMSYYVIKSMSRNTVDLGTYQQMKGRLAFMQDYSHGQSLGFEHFKPDNIIKRMNFEWDAKAKGQAVRRDLMPEED